MEATIKTLATKDDLVDIRKEIADFRKDMRDGFALVRKEIADSRADNIKWMFIFGLTQIGATATILLLLVKK